MVQTSSCQNRHLGYVLSGTLRVLMDDGSELDIRVGDAFEIPPGVRTLPRWTRQDVVGRFG